MSKRVTVDRPISPAEITVIRVMLERAAVTADCSRLLTELNALRVVYRCSCGCDSVDFQTFDPQFPVVVDALRSQTTAQALWNNLPDVGR